MKEIWEWIKLFVMLSAVVAVGNLIADLVIAFVAEALVAVLL